MPMSPFVTGAVQGLNNALDNIDQIRNQNDDRAYKSLVAQMMIRNQIMNERAQGYHSGYGPLAPEAPTTDSATPQGTLGNMTQSGAGVASQSALTPPSVSVAQPTAPKGTFVAPPDAVDAQGTPTGVKGFLARLFHSGPYAGQGLPTLPALGPINGLTEAGAAAQAAELAREHDADIAYGRSTADAATQHGYEVELEKMREGDADYRARLAEKGADARAVRSDRSATTSQLRLAVTNAQAELTASINALNRLKASFNYSPEDLQAAQNRVDQAQLQHEQMTKLLDEEEGVTYVPTAPIHFDTPGLSLPPVVVNGPPVGGAATTQSTTADQVAAQKVAQAIRDGKGTIGQALASPNLSAGAKAELRRLMGVQQETLNQALATPQVKKAVARLLVPGVAADANATIQP